MGSNAHLGQLFFYTNSCPRCSWFACCAFAFLPRSFHIALLFVFQPHFPPDSCRVYVGGLTLADAFPAVVYTCARVYLRGWGNVRKGERAVSLTSGTSCLNVYCVSVCTDSRKEIDLYVLDYLSKPLLLKPYCSPVCLLSFYLSNS